MDYRQIGRGSIAVHLDSGELERQAAALEARLRSVFAEMGRQASAGFSGRSASAVRTLEAWESRTRALHSAVDGLGEALRTGMTRSALPAASSMDELMASISRTGSAFRSFVGSLLGEEASDAASEAAESAEASGKRISTAAREIKRSLMGFDEIEKLADTGGGRTTVTETVGRSAAQTDASMPGWAERLREVLSHVFDLSSYAFPWDGFDLSHLQTQLEGTVEELVGAVSIELPAVVSVPEEAWDTLKEKLRTKLGGIAVDVPVTANAVVSAQTPADAAQTLAKDVREKLSDVTASVPVTANAAVAVTVPNSAWSDLKEKIRARMSGEAIEVPVTASAAVSVSVPEIAIDKNALKERIREAWSKASTSAEEELVEGGAAQPSANSLGELLFGKPENWGIEEAITGIFTGGTLATSIGSAVAGAVSAGAASAPAFAFTADVSDFQDSIPAAKKIIEKWNAKLESADDEIEDKNIPFTARLNNWFKDKSVWKGEDWTSIGFGARLNNWFKDKSVWKGEDWTSIGFGARLNNWFKDKTVWKGEDWTSIPFAAKLNDWFRDLSVWKGDDWTSIGFAARLIDWFKDTTVWKKSWDSIGFVAKLTDIDTSQLGSVITIGGQSFIARAAGGVFSGGVWRDIPQYAGGTTNAGSVFVAGEAGPELVGHIGGRTEVLNRSQLAATMNYAVSAGMRNMLAAATPHLAVIGRSVSRSEEHLAAIEQHTAPAAGGSAQQVELLKQILAAVLGIDPEIYLDGEKVKDDIVARINRRTRATGVCEIMV